MNIEELKKALLTLNTEDDAHWTEDGLPSLAVLSEILGAPTKRKDVTKGFPTFTRASAQANKDGADGKDDKGTPSGKDSNESEELEVENELQEARKEMSAAQARLNKANVAMDAVINNRIALDSKRTAAHDIQAYQSSQLKQRIADS